MRWLALLFLATAIGVAVYLGRPDPEPAGPAAEPGAARMGEAGFVGSEVCRECHEERHETWLKTAHAYSLREPDADSVRGRFDGKPVDGKHFRAIPYRQGSGYYIRVGGKDGRPSGDYRVARVIGRTFEQAYLLAGPRGEWRVLPICWSIERGEWDLTHEVLAEILGAASAFPDNYDSRNHVFNHGCGQCHATNYDVGHTVKGDTYKSTMLEGAVACESCHGPGSVHTAWHRGEFAEELEYEKPARLVHPREDLDARQVLDTCGRCHYLHEWRYAIDDDPLVSHREIAVSENMDRPGFYADGRLSGLNYHGTTQSQSACFVRGAMSCLHCHRMHSGKPWAMKFGGDSDGQCAQCHAEVAEKGKQHTFHDDVRCVDCHMPKFFKGVLHFARDHSIVSPEPELTERYGEEHAPNACGLCHGDETPSWAREWKEKWWGPAPHRIVEDVGMVVGLRRDAGSIKTSDLAAAVQRAESRLFFRMTALEQLGARLEPEARAAVRDALALEQVDLLQRACLLLGSRPDPTAGRALLKLVEHPVRTVRVEAAYALGRAGAYGKTPALERAYEDALKMLDRQRGFAFILERIALLADVVERAQDFRTYYEELLRMARWPSRKWPPRAIDLLHRHARRSAEAGNHDLALRLYARVRAFTGNPFPPLLYVDSADSLAATGDLRSAASIWKVVVDERKKGDALHTIAAARLAALARPETAGTAELEALARLLAQDPAAGRLLRRVRWSLAQVRGLR